MSSNDLEEITLNRSNVNSSYRHLRSDLPVVFCYLTVLPVMRTSAIARPWDFCVYLTSGYFIPLSRKNEAPLESYQRITIWSASIGAWRSMSRNIEAVSPDPNVVSVVRVRWMEDTLGGKPCRLAIAAHSSRSVTA